MLKLIFKRLFDLIPTLFVVATTVFIITRLIPGDPAAVLLGPQASPDEIAKMRETLGLNQPLYLQYVDFLGSLLQGDLGTSLGYNQRSCL